VDDELAQLTATVAREQEAVLLINEYVSEADLYYAMRNADVAVLPHRRISQSGVLLTALAQRIPVLVSGLPGLVEPFEYAKVGWQFDGTVGGLVEALLSLTAHRERVEEVKADDTAWQAVEEEYAWRRIGLNARGVYRELIETRDPGSRAPAQNDRRGASSVRPLHQRPRLIPHRQPVVNEVPQRLLQIRLPSQQHEPRLARQKLERPPRELVAVPRHEI